MLLYIGMWVTYLSIQVLRPSIDPRDVELGEIKYIRVLLLLLFIYVGQGVCPKSVVRINVI